MKISKSDNKASLKYYEKKQNLSIRIQAHKKFSNFSLEEWTEKNIPLKIGEVILDIGCGNGNLFPTYSKKLDKSGVIVGIDKSEDLLNEAKKSECNSSVILMHWEMDNKFPFLDETFNHVISTFAIYYVDNVDFIVGEMQRILKKRGRIFLIGPTQNNAKELYDFNYKIFKFTMDEKTAERTTRLETEFYPAMKRIIGNVKKTKVPRKIVFPDKTEFVKYYMATLLYEESVKKTHYKPNFEELISCHITSLELSKELILVQSDK